MSRPTLRDLAQRCARAAMAYPIGSHIRHQKSGSVYEIMFFSTREADAEVLITFRPVAYDGKPQLLMISEFPVDERDALITRPLSEIEQLVEWDRSGDVVQCGNRFVRVVKKETWVDA